MGAAVAGTTSMTRFRPARSYTTLWDVTPKGTTTRKPGRDPDPVVPFGPSASIRNHAIDGARFRPLGAMRERGEPRPLGAFLETGSSGTLEALAKGSLGGACSGCEARGRSRWEGWGDPLTKAMRGRLSPRPGPSCATVFGRGSPHPSGQTPVPRACIAHAPPDTPDSSVCLAGPRPASRAQPRLAAPRRLRLVPRLQLDLALGPRPAFFDLLPALSLRVELVAEEDRDVRDPEPDQQDDEAGEGAVGLVV